MKMSRTRWRAFKGKQHDSRFEQVWFWFEGSRNAMIEWLGPMRPIEGFLYTAADKTFSDPCEPKTGWLFHAGRLGKASHGY